MFAGSSYDLRLKKEGQVAAPVQAKGTLRPRGSRCSLEMLRREDARSAGSAALALAPRGHGGARLRSRASALEKRGVE